MRRPWAPYNGKRYIGNADPHHMEVHDLDNEKSLCQINEIKKVATFTPDSVHTAISQGYNGCYWCLREYHTS